VRTFANGFGIRERPFCRYRCWLCLHRHLSAKFKV